MKNKIGALFVVSAMALAGIGISYAGFTDTLTVHGSVDVATLSHTVGPYSGTWVWKVWGSGAPAHEVYIDYTGGTAWQSSYPNCQFLRVARSWAEAGIGYNVELTWENIFPCIDFTCDFDFTYTGDIPVKINAMSVVYGTESDWIDAYLSYELKKGTDPVVLGTQLHSGDTVHCVFTIHLPQDDLLQGKTATATASLELIQWNEFPYPPP